MGRPDSIARVLEASGFEEDHAAQTKYSTVDKTKYEVTSAALFVCCLLI
jgi:hypothetical protein